MSPVSFAQDIRPLFRDKDIESMQDFGDFDLSQVEDVRDHAGGIYKRLAEGSMPCDGAWPPDRVAIFKQWMDGGMAA